MSTVLVVCLWKSGREEVAETLRRAGFQVKAAEGDEAILRVLYEERPDLVVMGDDPPGVEGLCARIRRSTPVPVLIIGQANEFTRAMLLDLGADAYLVEPVSAEELAVRAHNLVRRYKAARPANLRFDPEADSVQLGRGKVVQLTRTEFRLLSCLAFNEGKALSFRRLIDEVWGGKAGIDTLHCYARRLKHKLSIGSTSPYRLSNQRGESYRLYRRHTLAPSQ